jgi:4-aminobutyrate aminotransferase-like enzyme
MEKTNLAAHATRLGQRILARLEKIKANSEYVGDVRGRGLMIGIEFVKDKNTKKPAEDAARDVRKRCYMKGLIVELGGHYSNVVRFLPPLVLTERLADIGLDIFAAAVNENEKASS